MSTPTSASTSSSPTNSPSTTPKARPRSQGKVNLKNFTVNAFQGTIKSQGTLDLHDQAKKPFDLDLSISNIESGELLPKFTSFGKYLAGKLNMNTKLKGDLNDTLGLNTQSLLGNGDV